MPDPVRSCLWQKSTAAQPYASQICTQSLSLAITRASFCFCSASYLFRQSPIDWRCELKECSDDH